jgi:hypothetical protein
LIVRTPPEMKVTLMCSALARRQAQPPSVAGKAERIASPSLLPIFSWQQPSAARRRHVAKANPI